MTGVIETFKAAFLGTGSIIWANLALSAFMSIVFLIFGLLYFLQMEKSFADII